LVDQILESARAAVRGSPPLGAANYADLCDAIRDNLHREWKSVLEANEIDMAGMVARSMPSPLIDRVRLGERQLEHLGRFVDDVRAAMTSLAARPQPSHQAGTMRVRRIVKPLGVVFMIYEARPAVTVEGALLPVVAGNAVIMRGGTEIAETNRALAGVLRGSLVDAGLDEHLIQVLDDTDRTRLRTLLTRHDAIDVLIPRGSPSLIDFCRSASSIPVIASGGGVNQLYVHAGADLALAAEIVLDSKLPEPTACNTLQTVLCDAAILGPLIEAIVHRGEPCTLRVPPEYCHTGSRIVRLEPLSDMDRGREFLERTVVLRPVAGLADAVDYIHAYGSGHTEAICATDSGVVADFCRRVDAAAIVVNGSLRLHDGQTMRLGPEISIGTGRLHVRGPVDLSALTTYSWVIDANGTLRGSSAGDGSE
jgi:glutamate-5-semialdehyde dehydrogenase